jgi:serine/threonine-protein kinase RsbW
MPESQTPKEVIALRIPSRLDMLALVDRITDALCDRLSFGDEARTQVSLSVVEAGTNAIVHGHGRDPARMVDLEFRVRPRELEIRVKDGGAGFDLASVNGDMTSPEHLFDNHGRGIFIMRNCMDEVNFEFSSSGTLCRLVKRRPAATGG